MKQQILVDMDGVLADVYAQYIAWEYSGSGVRLEEEKLNGVEEQDLPGFRRHVETRGFFRTVPLMTRSVEGLRYLNDRYKVLIVSSATEFPHSLNEKQQWLNAYFPFIGWQQMIFCGSKDSIRGDIMIDDHPKNLRHFDGQKIIFTQPHNACLEEKDYVRVSGWEDIMKIL